MTNHTGDDIEQLAVRAAAVLTSHTERGTRCSACGAAWPCRDTLNAAHNLELSSQPPRTDHPR